MVYNGLQWFTLVYFGLLWFTLVAFPNSPKITYGPMPRACLLPLASGMAAVAAWPLDLRAAWPLDLLAAGPLH
jgi:hypothetical protein